MLTVISASTATIMWFVQLVLYPLLRDADPATFHGIHSQYVKKMHFFITPILAVECITTSYYLYVYPTLITFTSFITLIIGICITWFYFRNWHISLDRRFSKYTMNKIIHWNWLRVLLWSCKLLLAINTDIA